MTTPINTLVTLVRREFWEHRALWMAPLVVSTLLLLCAFPPRIGFMTVGVGGHSPGSGSVTWDYQWHAVPLPPRQRVALFALAQWALAIPQFLVMAIVLSFYLLDCLYAERRDRSILFWKSLPVSDGATVGSKLLVALVVVPLGVFALALATNLLFGAIWNLRVSLSHPGANLTIWYPSAFVQVEALLLYGLIASILWYAPLAAYTLLVSAWARRNVFLWSTLPPLLAALAERLAFGTHYVTGLLQYRTVGLWRTLGLRHAIEQAFPPLEHETVLTSVRSIFDNVSFTAVFANVDVWGGLAVAAVLAYAAARIRRYRDDT